MAGHDDISREGLSVERLAGRVLAGGWRSGAICFVALLSVYALSAPANLTESDDGYAFASATEDCGLRQITDTRTLLYHVLVRSMYATLDALGMDLCALTMMRVLSAVSASLALLLFARLLHRGFSLTAFSSLIGVGLLGVCYGYWRYAVEAEVYAPAILLVLGVVTLAFEVDDRKRAGRLVLLLTALLAGVAVLFYQPNGIALFIALPLLFVKRDSLGRLLLYGAVGGGVIVAGYLGAYLYARPVLPEVNSISEFLSQRSNEVSISPLSLGFVLKAPIKAAITFSHNVASFNWVFGVETLVPTLRSAFSGNFIEEEIFAAAHARALVPAAALTFTALAAAAACALAGAGRGALQSLRQRRVLVCCVWVLVYAALIARVKPWAMEAWIMVLPPFVILIAVLVVEPCVQSARRAAPIALLAALFAHNALGGMGIVRSAEGDYERVKSRWVVEHGGAADLVVLSGLWSPNQSPRMHKFITYHGAPRVVFMNLVSSLTAGPFRQQRCLDYVDVGEWRYDPGVLTAPMFEQTWRDGGRVFAFDEFFIAPYWREAVYPRQYAGMAELLDALKRAAVPVHRNSLGTTYELRPLPPAGSRSPVAPPATRPMVTPD